MPEPRREPVCDKPGCGKPATGYDAWGEWCDDHNGGLEPAGRPIDHAKTIRRALDHLPDAEDEIDLVGLALLEATRV